jgi:hypothetical protein
MSLPTQDAGSNSYGFTGSSSSLPSLQGMQSALGSASKAIGAPTSSTGGGARGAGGGVRLQAQNFQVPILDYVPAGGTAGGNSLLQLLQKLKPGSTS